MKRIPIAIVLLAMTVAGNALTLGKARGSAIIGRSLEVTLPVQTAAEETFSPSCLEAEVFYGEQRQDTQRVAITEATSLPGSAVSNIRIVSAAPVNEPVVTIYVIAGCGQKSKRRFVFFSDVVSEVLGADMDAAGASLKSKAQSMSPVVVPVTLADPAKSEQGTSGVSPLAATTAEEVLTHAKVKTGRPPLVRGRPSSAKPKLKLAVSEHTKKEPTPRRDATVSQPLADELGKRVDLLTEWQSLNLSPEVLQKRTEQLRLLESEMKGLREAAQKNQKTLLDVSAKLGQAQPSLVNPLVLSLGALSALLAVAVAVLLLRKSRATGSPWWGESAAIPTAIPSVEVSHSGQSPIQVKASGEKPLAQEAVETWASDVDIDLDFGVLMDAEGSDSQLPTPTMETPAVATVSGLKGTKVLNLREMMDVRQQAEFFMTLGQHDEAIETLTNTLHGDGNINPLMYLDLLKVLHTLSRKSGFDYYRSEFNTLFTGVVPEYATFTHHGRDLESYPQICEEIVKRWPSLGAVSYIESLLVCQPGDKTPLRFDLDAYRDLLLLHGVLKRLEGSVESDFAPFSAPKVSEYSSLSAAQVDIAVHGLDEPEPTVESIFTAPMDMDFDLSEQETKPAPVPLPEVASNNMIDFDLSALPGWSDDTSSKK